MDFTIYNPDNGRVLFGGTADDPSILVPPGAAMLEGYIFSDGYFADGMHHPVPAQPSRNHVFNWDTKVWEDPRTLQQLKDAKTDEINAASLKANTSTFPYLGKRFQVDAVSRSYIEGANGAFMHHQGPPPDWPGGWKAEDNTYIPINTLEEWVAFYGAMVSAGTANFNHSQSLKAQLEAATTPEEVAAVPSW